MIGGADGRDIGGDIAGCTGTPASFEPGVLVVTAGGYPGDADAPGAKVGRCAKGAGCVPSVGRGAAAFVDGRTKGADRPGPCTGRGGVTGVPPGKVDRTGGDAPTAPAPAVGVKPVRAGVGSGATGADDRSAGLGAADAGEIGGGATTAADNAGVIAGVGRAGAASEASAGVGRVGCWGTIGGAIAGVGRAGVTAAIADGIAGVGRAGVDGMVGCAMGVGRVTGRASTGVGEPGGGVATDGEKVDAPNSSPSRSPASIVMTAPQTEQRARTLDVGTRAGSTRNTDRHSGQATFMQDLPRARRAWVRRCA
jgi:hypothetical protein